jgi:hypothetical protein
MWSLATPVFPNATAAELRLLGENLHAILAPDLQGFGVAVCGVPFFLCSVLRSFTDLPFLLYIVQPVLAPVPDHARAGLLLQLREMLASPRTVVLAANELAASQVAYQTGRPCPFSKPMSLYVNATYKPSERGNYFVMCWRMSHWAGDVFTAFANVVDMFVQERAYPYRFHYAGTKNTPEYYGWNRLSVWRAILFFPWDLQLVIFPELYALAAPLLVPGPRWMLSNMHFLLLDATKLFWAPSLRTDFSGALPGAAGVSPWVETDDEDFFARCSYWWSRTDFMRYPHVLHFESIPEMLDLVEREDLPEISRSMIAVQRENVEVALEWYRDTALSLLEES